MMFLPARSLSIPRDIRNIFEKWSVPKSLVLTTFLAVLATIFQSAGGYVPGVGFFISPLSTLPIFLAFIIFWKYGLLAYSLTIFLLIFAEPSELFIFPFTTGLLALGMGWSLFVFRRSVIMILVNGFILLIGICIPLYGLGAPILGPATPTGIDLKVLSAIFAFSALYSWLWLWFSLYFLRRIKGLLSMRL